MTIKINPKSTCRKKCIAFLHVCQQAAPQSAWATGRKSGDPPSKYGLEQIFPMPIWTSGKGCSLRGQSVTGTGSPGKGSQHQGCRSSRSLWMISQTCGLVLGSPERSRDSHSTGFMDPFQIKTFYDFIQIFLLIKMLITY